MGPGQRMRLRRKNTRWRAVPELAGAGCAPLPDARWTHPAFVTAGVTVMGGVYRMPENISVADYRQLLVKRPHKYGAKKTTVEGIAFASAAEGARYGELCLLERAGAIAELQLQPSYELQPAFIDQAGRRVRKIEYRADFAYIDVETSMQVAEDVKGVETAIFKLKAKLFKRTYPAIDLRIIRTGRASRASAPPKLRKAEQRPPDRHKPAQRVNARESV